ncbi:amino acid adenylation domain-containing protein, partial [Streptomyces sp. NPDC092952]|uniref:amino acid adenylation domain-containing protein n=1 Tax=Streptomyces sp. NPDC092952 TaxID=3366018 RepID=UPI0037F3FF0A
MTRRAVSTAQAGIWVAQQLDPRNPFYNCAVAFTLTGPLDHHALARAVDRAVAETDTLRSRFDEEQGRPQVTVLAADQAQLTTVGLSGNTDPAAAADAWMHADLARPVDLGSEPPYAHVLFTLAGQRHILYFRYHHIVLDGFGQYLYCRRLAELYTAYESGATPAPGAAAPLATLLDDNAAYRASAAHEADAAHWRGEFAELPASTPLAGHTVPAGPSVVRRTWLAQDRVDALLGAGRAAIGGWSATVVAATAAYLARLQDTSEVLVNLPLAARRTSAELLTPAMLANELPLRLAVGHATTFAELVAQTREKIRLAVRHQRYRRADLRSDLGLAGHDSALTAPQVNVMAFEKETRFGSLAAERHQLSTGLVADVNINVYRAPGGADGRQPGMQLEFHANGAAFDIADLARHQERFLAFLERATAQDSRPLAALDVLAPGERELVLDSWNETGTRAAARSEAGSGPETLTTLFEAAVARTPDAPALHHDLGTLTYAELNARANRLAHHLIAQGAGPESYVGVAVPRSADMIVAVLAVLKSGAAYVPIDAAYPADRIARMLKTARPALILTTEALAARLPLHDARALALDTLDLTGLPGLREDNPTDGDRTAPLTGDSLAYVIFTSGSTGRPKGVLGVHTGAVNRLRWFHEAFPFRSDEPALAKSSLSFVDGTTEWFGPLVHHAPVVLAGPDAARSATSLTSLVQRHRVGRVTLAPSLLDALLDSDQDGALRSCTLWVTSGEELPRGLARRFAEELPGARLLNLYGSSEASGDSLYALCGSGDVTIGRPIANTRAYVLDARLRPVPVGVIGELHLAGDGLARGYLGRPDLTAGRFVANPYGPAGTRMYRTGDLARWTEEGTLEYLGRTDHQVKVRGFRIEPSEIEAVLSARPEVLRAAAVVREDRPGDKRLVAYVVPANPGHDGPDVAALRSAVADALPDYMVPSAFVILDDLPLNPNGKLDRAALPAPRFTSTGEGPRTPREEQFCALFAEALGLEWVGVHDSFFDLGGDSVLALRLVSRVRRAGLALAARDVFVHRTVAALAAASTDTADAATTADPAYTVTAPLGAEELAGLQLPSGSAVLPLTPLQEGMLFHSVYDEAAADLYTVQAVLDLGGTLDTGALQNAAKALLARHDALRVSFRHEGLARPVQVVRATAEPAWRTADAAAPGTLEDLLSEERSRRFDLTGPPLVRFLLVRLDGDRHCLALTAHHTVIDGWSLPVVVRELFQLYAAQGAGSEPHDLPRVRPYQDYMGWLSTRDREAAQRAWCAVFAGFDEPALLGAPRPGRTPVVPGRHRTALSSEATARLAERARSLGATLNSVVRAAWGIVLARHLGRTDLAFGATVSGRPAELDGVEDMVGLFINTLPVRLRLDPAEELGGLISRLQDEQSALIEHQHVGLIDVQRWAGVGELFDASLVFENYPLDHAALSAVAASTGLHLGDARAHEGAHYTVSLVVHPGDKLTFRLDFQPDLLDASTVEALAQRLVRVLEAVVADPSVQVGRVEVLSAAERELLLGEWNDTAREVPAVALPQLFEERARRSPDELAVVCGESAITYRELNERANRLARVLVASGAGPERFVAVRLSRGVDLVVALLAVLKSGAAYVPVDPDFPAERITYMIEDARPVLVIDQEWLAGTDVPPVDAGNLAPVSIDVAAYAIYTSGSTGRPKGVVIGHKA